MRQINKTNMNWDKEIEISLTLKELQILNDSIWNVAPKSFNYGEKIPYEFSELDNLCDVINYIITENGGYDRSI